MSEQIEATGLESAVITHWSGWDGDGVEWVCFYGVTLRPEVKEYLEMYHLMPKGIVDVEILGDKLEANIMIYEKENDEHKLAFKATLKLKVSVDLP